jgi:hypothetical protein
VSQQVPEHDQTFRDLAAHATPDGKCTAAGLPYRDQLLGYAHFRGEKSTHHSTLAE